MATVGAGHAGAGIALADPGTRRIDDADRLILLVGKERAGRDARLGMFDFPRSRIDDEPIFNQEIAQRHLQMGSSKGSIEL